MTDKLLRSKYNFTNRLTMYVMRQENKTTGNGVVQSKGARASQPFCTAVLEEQTPEGKSSSDLTEQQITKSEVT